jgi:hypothetical protein
VADTEEPFDGYVERALLTGELTPLTAPLQPGESGAVARWVGTRAAVVAEFSYDAEADPGAEYDVFVYQFKRTATGEWEDEGGAGGFDCPVVPGDRPVFSADDFPIAGLNGTTYGPDGTVVTFGVAAPKVAAIELHSAAGVTRSEVGVFGAVILATQHPPAEVVLLDAEGSELKGRWHPQIHTDFTARSVLSEDPPEDGRY